MPILTKDIDSNFRLFVPSQTVGEVLASSPEQDGFYAVVAFPEGRYAAVHLSELRQALAGMARLNDRTALLHTSLGDLLAELSFPAVDQESVELWQADQTRRQTPTQVLVVLSAGSPAGVLAPPRQAQVTYRSGERRGRQGAGAGSDFAPSLPAAEPDARRINVEITAASGEKLKPEERPLQVSETYTLAFSVSERLRPTSLVADAFLKLQWQEDEQEAHLNVRLESDDFEILTSPQALRVPRQGDSNKARFDVTALREGRGLIHVLFFKGEAFLQLLTLKFTIVAGDMFSSETSGRSLEAAYTLQPRPLNLTILEASGGYRLIMSGAVAATATLPVTAQALAHHVSEARRSLKDGVVAMRTSGGQFVFQEQVRVSPAARDLALRRMAETGYHLYREIFYSFDADAQANRLGDRLREMARAGDVLQIQIFAQHFNLPWGLLYLAAEGEYDPDDIHPEWFLGFSHIVENIPLQQTLKVTRPEIDGRDGLVVSINVNEEIDREMGAPLVASQVAFWKSQSGPEQVHFVQRTSSAELVEELRNPLNSDQVLYFYCHAASKDLAEGGPDASVLVFGSQDRLLLGDLKRRAPHTWPLAGEPLVFINACESAELSPLFYDGFVPYFLAKGARGVIGTECEVPAVFALEWAQRFFERFLRGEKVGETALALRKAFLRDENNPLGLLYALYVDGDTRLKQRSG